MLKTEIIREGGKVKYDGDYAMYLRKSREDIELEKYENVDTLSRHEKMLEKYAKDHNISIGHIYRDVVSGESIEERKVMQEVIEDVENKEWKGILVVEVERLARGDTADQGIVANAFKYSHTKILTPIKTYDPDNEYDEEYFEFGLFMSRREYKTINRRMQRGRAISSQEGKYVSNTPPLGYKIIKIKNDKGYMLEIEPNEVGTVKKIFELYAYQEQSISDIVKTLNDLGLKPKRLKKWSTSTIRDILSNPVYIGMIKWGARKQEVNTVNGKKKKSRPRNKNVYLYKGLHEPIIDKETWDITQERRKKNAPAVPHSNKLQNPLAGIIYCDKCGKPMQRRPYTSKKKEPTLICNNPDCDNISSKLAIVENKIIEALKIWLKSYTVDLEKISKIKKSSKILTDRDILKQMENNLKKEQQRLTRIYETFEDGIYDADEFKERLSVCKVNILELENKIKPLKESIRIQEAKIEQNKNIVPKIENVIDIYDKLETEEEKNTLLKTILEKVTYIKTEKALKKTDEPTNFEIHIYPKIPKME